MEFEELTWREQEVLSLLAERLTNREIADRLHLAESTVKDYVSNILGKLYVKNRRQAVERGRELGLLQGGLPAEFSTKTNLPAESTPFIGRLDELEEIQIQLEKTRLLTLTGPGGIGKTRLALKAAAEVAGTFKDGCFFVSLAPIHALEHITQTIAEAVDFPLGTDEDPQYQLLHYLQKKQLLLVIDNFEHLLDGAEIVSEILKTASSVKILATSRESLNLQSETKLNIRGMELPRQEATEDLLNYDAIKLFVQRARKVNSTFYSSPDDLKKIANICQIVQGIPLAIELSAAWLQILSLKEITEELEKSFDILVSEVRDLPKRHRSIRAIFEHTWSLIQPAEQETFLLLSVFRGGFTREAAQQVAGASLQLLGSLVNKSILIYRSKTSRFEIHELLRQYAQEKLEKNLKAKRSAHEAHATYYAEFMQQRWHHLKDGRQITALNEIDGDLENIRAAWRYHVGRADAQQMQKFINSFWLVYWIRGWNLAAVRLFENAVKALSDRQGDGDAEIVRANALAHLGFFLAWLGLAEQGYIQAKESIEILERLNNPLALFFAYHGLTLPAYYLERFDEEKEASEKALKIARTLEDKWLIAFALFLTTLTTLRDKDYIEAIRLSEESVKLTEAIEDMIIPALSLMSLGHLAKFQKDFPKAKHYYLRSVRASEKIGFRWAFGNSTKYLGQVALAEGEIAEAETYFLQSLRIAYDLGLERDIANHLFEFARVRVAQGRPEQAAELLILLLEQPVSQQARFERGRIRDNARDLLANLETDLSLETYAAVLRQGRKLALDDVLSELLGLKK